MSPANDSLFFEIIRGDHGPDPAASRYYRPFDVGPRVTIASRAGAGGRLLAAVVGWVGAKAGSRRRQAVPVGSTASACCQPA